MHQAEISMITPELYRERSSALFSEWKESANRDDNPLRRDHTPFITDGVMDPDTWFKANERPLFILKEAYDTSSENDWDLANDHVLTSESARKIWKRISFWAKGMLEDPEIYDPKAKDIELFGNQYLHRIAAINLKKYNGKKTSDNDDILKYAEHDKNFIRKQVEICDPTVIICCYTARAFNKVIDFGWETNWSESRFYHTVINNHPVLVLDYYHPSNYYPEILNYYGLLEIYKHAKCDHRNKS